MPVDRVPARLRWMRTGDAYFPAAAEVDGVWWVLRINSFPDHPLWTLFVDGVRSRDVDLGQEPPGWDIPDPENPPMDGATVEGVLAPIVSFIAYGSEVGQACDNMFCCG